MRKWVVLLLVAAVCVPAVASAGKSPDRELMRMLNSANTALAAEGAEYRAVKAEYLSTDGDKLGNVVISKIVGNKQLAEDFVPYDSRREWSSAGGSAITYAIDTTGDAVPLAGGMTGAQTDAAIVRGMDTWDALTCSDLSLSRNPDFGIDIGLLAFQISGGAIGSPFVFADIQHAGWRDLNFSGGVLGVTYTYLFCDPCGNNPVFTDIDQNGRLDTAFREIYYDPIQPDGAPWPWVDDGVSSIDVESVALHEAGHGLSQAHFGKVFIDKKDYLKFAPKAVMNAVYTGPQRELLGTDNGGHCSNWGQWPQN